jgi:hypothetical protein
MNGKVAKMLRKTGRESKAAKRWWNSLEPNERGDLRTAYNVMNDKRLAQSVERQRKHNEEKAA